MAVCCGVVCLVVCCGVWWCVVAWSRARLEGDERSDVDDGAAPLAGDHPARHSLREEEGALGVDVEH